MMGMGMMPPPMMGGGGFMGMPNGVQPGGVMDLLMQLGNPMGAAMATSGAANPLSPEEQAMLNMMTNGGQQSPTNQQVPGMMAMIQLLKQGMGAGAGGAMGGMPMGGGMPMMPAGY